MSGILGIASGLPIVAFVFLVCAAFRYHSLGFSVASIVVAIPLIVFVPLFTSVGVEAIDLVASLWRTRIVNRKSSAT